MMYFKIIYYDKKGQYIKHEITDSLRAIRLLIDSNNMYIAIYKCNSKGNNYTHHMLYPICQLSSYNWLYDPHNKLGY